MPASKSEHRWGGATATTGVLVSGGSNVTIQNGAITGIDTGVEVDSGQQCQLVNLNITAGQVGIDLVNQSGNTGINGNTIRNCTLTGGGDAIQLLFENSDLIKNCFIVNPTNTGVVAEDGALGNNVISNCKFTNTSTVQPYPLGMGLGGTDVYQNIVFAGQWQSPPIQGGMPAK